MFDIKAIEREAKDELAKERATAAKSKIKKSLQAIAQADAVLRNLCD